MAGPAGSPPQFSEFYKLMADLMVLAWQTDMTRVCSFQIGHEMGGRAYPEVGFGDSHHSVTHHQGDPEKIAKVIQINIFHTKLLAYYLGKLRATQDGEGSLLDHSIFVYGSGISDGNIHFHLDLPMVVVGGGAGTLKGGRHVRYGNDTPLANLYLTLLDHMGVHLDHFADSTGKINGVFEPLSL